MKERTEILVKKVGITSVVSLTIKKKHHQEPVPVPVKSLPTKRKTKMPRIFSDPESVSK